MEKISAFTKENLFLQTILKFECLLSKININSSGIRHLIGNGNGKGNGNGNGNGFNSNIQLNYHMFTSNIRTITTVPNLNIYLNCQF